MKKGRPHPDTDAHAARSAKLDTRKRRAPARAGGIPQSEWRMAARQLLDKLDLGLRADDEGDLRHVERQMEMNDALVRTDMAGKIHDSLSQLLVGATMQLQASDDLVLPDQEALRSHLSRALDLTRDALGLTRTAAWTWSAVEQVALGDLPKALEQLCHRLFDAAQIRLHFSVPSRHRPLPPPQATKLLVAARQALANTALHSGATEVWIELRDERGMTCLSIRDNGKGFNSKAPRRLNSFGLVNMGRLIRALRGRLSVETSPGQGTSVEMRVPNPHGAGRANHKNKPLHR